MAERSTLLAATVMLCAAVAGAGQRAAQSGAAVRQARARLEAFLDRRYVEFIRDLDPTTAQPCDLETIRARGETLRALFGRPCTIDSREVQRNGDKTMVRFRGAYERAAAPGRSVFDPLDREALDFARRFRGTLLEQELSERCEQVPELFRRYRQGQGAQDARIHCPPLAYWRRLDQLDVVAAARELRQQLFVVGVGRDVFVTREDFEYWRAGLSGREHVKLRWYPTLDLTLVPRQQAAGPDGLWQGGYVVARLIDDLARWVHELRPIRRR